MIAVTRQARHCSLTSRTHSRSWAPWMKFRSEHGVNTEKYRSFELYRRNISRPEIITFDELYERAKFIVKHVDG